MLTSDVSLMYDESYESLVSLFASDMTEYEHAFKHAW